MNLWESETKENFDFVFKNDLGVKAVCKTCNTNLPQNCSKIQRKGSGSCSEIWSKWYNSHFEIKFHPSPTFSSSHEMCGDLEWKASHLRPTIEQECFWYCQTVGRKCVKTFAVC